MDYLQRYRRPTCRAHNPKVAGSNPAPLRKALVSELTTRASTVFGSFLPSVPPAFYRLLPFASSWFDQVLEDPGSVGLHSRENVLIGVDGEGRIAWPNRSETTVTGESTQSGQAR